MSRVKRKLGFNATDIRSWIFFNMWSFENGIKENFETNCFSQWGYGFVEGRVLLDLEFQIPLTKSNDKVQTIPLAPQIEPFWIIN